MTMLNEKALEAALAVEVLTTRRDHMKRAIAAYLSALLPEDAAGLVERLRNEQSDGWSGDACAVSCDLADEAASLIQSQAARIAELEAGLEPFSKDAAKCARMSPHSSIAHVTTARVHHLRTANALLNKDRQP